MPQSHYCLGYFLENKCKEVLKMEKFFCLSSDGLIYFLGSFEQWEDAEQEASKRKIDVIWLFGEESARSWTDTIQHELS
jgi:hypothetical protein